METQYTYNLYDRRPIVKSRNPAVKWFKEWVPQDVVATGGICFILKWVDEQQLKALKEKAKEPPPPEPEPEPTTEVLFLCSFEGCGKTFVDAGALRKHSHIHGERQYVCHYEGCGKKFLDSSKLKRHFLIHTGERHFVCPHEGCGKAFSLDFNLKSHMKTHSQENYHVCPYPECGKRYAHEYKLKNHVAAHHAKSTPPTMDVPRYATPPEKVPKIPKPSSATYGSASLQRNFVCPYEGCDKAYLHKYKLNLHLKREHPDHDENDENATLNADEMDQGSDQDVYVAKRVSSKNQKQNRPKPNVKLPPAKTAQPKGSSPSTSFVGVAKKPWPVKEGNYEEDSEETEEEDRENVEDRWRYGENNEDDDDEETEDED